MNLAKPVKVKEGSSRASMCIVTTAFCGMIIIFSPSLMNSKMAFVARAFPCHTGRYRFNSGKGQSKILESFAMQCNGKHKC